MFEKIPAPVKGQPARASWGSALTSRVNELCAMAPARGLARDGLTGTGFAALPSNRRERGATRLPGLFEAKLETSDQGGKKVKFECPYYMVGTRLYRCEDKDVVLQAGKGIYCLVVDLSATEPKGVIGIYEDFGGVQEAAASPTVSIKPLYEFGDQGTPIRDFRNMPTVSTQEFAV